MIVFLLDKIEYGNTKHTPNMSRDLYAEIDDLRARLHASEDEQRAQNYLIVSIFCAGTKRDHGQGAWNRNLIEDMMMMPQGREFLICMLNDKNFQGQWSLVSTLVKLIKKNLPIVVNFCAQAPQINWSEDLRYFAEGRSLAEMVLTCLLSVENLSTLAISIKHQLAANFYLAFPAVVWHLANICDCERALTIFHMILHQQHPNAFLHTLAPLAANPLVRSHYVRADQLFSITQARMAAYLLLCAQKDGAPPASQIRLLDTFLIRQICDYISTSANVEDAL